MSFSGCNQSESLEAVVVVDLHYPSGSSLATGQRDLQEAHASYRGYSLAGGHHHRHHHQLYIEMSLMKLDHCQAELLSDQHLEQVELGSVKLTASRLIPWSEGVADCQLSCCVSVLNLNSLSSLP